MHPMADINRRDAFLGVLIKLSVNHADTIPTELLDVSLAIQLVVVPRSYEKVLERKLQEMRAEITALENERINNIKETVN